MRGMFWTSDDVVRRIYRNWGIGIFALPVLIVIAVVGLVQGRPSASNLMSDAVRTEFAGPKALPGAAATQRARPAATVRTVRVN